MKIEHAALYVNDLEKARSFFVNYLGAESNGGYGEDDRKPWRRSGKSSISDGTCRVKRKRKIRRI